MIRLRAWLEVLIGLYALVGRLSLLLLHEGVQMQSVLLAELGDPAFVQRHMEHLLARVGVSCRVVCALHRRHRDKLALGPLVAFIFDCEAVDDFRLDQAHRLGAFRRRVLQVAIRLFKKPAVV